MPRDNVDEQRAQVAGALEAIVPRSFRFELGVRVRVSLSMRDADDHVRVRAGQGHAVSSCDRLSRKSGFTHVLSIQLHNHTSAWHQVPFQAG